MRNTENFTSPSLSPATKHLYHLSSKGLCLHRSPALHLSMSSAMGRHTMSRSTRRLPAALHNQLRRYIYIYIYILKYLYIKTPSKQSMKNHTYPYIRGPSTSCNAYISKPSLGKPTRGNDVRGTAWPPAQPANAPRGRVNLSPRSSFTQRGFRSTERDMGTQEHFENRLVFHLDFFFLFFPRPFC